MDELILDEEFRFFVSNYGIDEEAVRQTYDFPDKKMKFSETKVLFYKRVSDREKQHFLLCSEIRNNRVLFSFAFWIPEECIAESYSLEDYLELFAKKFGSKIEIGNEISYCIKEKIIEFTGDKIALDQIIKTFANTTTPHYRHYNAIPKGKEALLRHAFAINAFKYLAWLNDSEFETISINAEWEDYLTNVVDNLNPVERTKLEIKTVSKKYLSYNSIPEVKDKVDFSFPKLYSKQFEIIVNSVEKGGNVKVLFPISEDEKKCIFCGNKEVSKEHIFPKWFRNYFSEQIFDNVSGPLDYNDLEGSITKGATGGQESSYGITSRNVCKNCNNGWMSDLEKKIKSIITKNLITLNGSVNELNLTKDISFTLSRWLICKAILLSMRNNNPLLLPDGVYLALKENKIHKGFIVEVLPTRSHGLNYMSQFSPSFQGGQKLFKDYFEDITFLFVSVIHIGNLLYRVSYWEHEKELLRVSMRLPTVTLLPYGYELPFPKGGEIFDIDKYNGNNLLLFFAESLSLIENHPSSFAS